MRSANRQLGLVMPALLAGLLAAGTIVSSGCAPEPEPAAGPQIKPQPEAAQQPPAAEEQPSPQPAEPSAARPAPAAAEAQQQPAAAELPPAPAVSTFAPAQDLVAQVESYLDNLQEAVQSEQQYRESAGTIAQDANTLVVIALALGLHDSDNQYKAAAPALIKASQQLAAAQDYPSAQQAVAAIKAAASSSQGDPAKLKWEKVASLPELMKAVPLINSKLKRYARKGREQRMQQAADQLAGYAAVLAVIAQGSMANSDETGQPDKSQQWIDFCLQMRQAAAAVNTAVRAFQKEPTPDAFQAWRGAIEQLGKSCDDCHQVFHPQ